MDVIDLLPPEDQLEENLVGSVQSLALDDYLVGIDTATNDVCALQDMAAVIQASDKDLDERSLQIVQAHINNTEKTYAGMITPGIALESVAGKANRTLALEGLGDLIDRIIAMIKATFSFIVDTVKNILGLAAGAKEEASTQKKVELLKDLKAHPEKYDPDAVPKEGQRKFIPPVSNHQAKVLRIDAKDITPELMLTRYADVEKAIVFIDTAINHFGSQLGSLEKLFKGLETEGFTSDNTQSMLGVVNKFTAAVERLPKVSANEVSGTILSNAEYVYGLEVMRDTPRVFVGIGSEDNPFFIQHVVEKLQMVPNACTTFDSDYHKSYEKIVGESIHLAKSRKDMFDLMTKILHYLKPIEVRLTAQLSRIKADADSREDPALNKDIFGLLKELIRSLSQYTVFIITATMQVQECSDHLDAVALPRG